jgi:hypothetical protein
MIRQIKLNGKNAIIAHFDFDFDRMAAMDVILSDNNPHHLKLTVIISMHSIR